MHEGFLDQLWRRGGGRRAPRRRGADRRPGPGLRRAAAAAAAQLAHPVAPGPGARAGPESSWVKLAWTDMTQHLSATALDVVGPARRCGARGSASGSGPRRPRSPGAPPRCSAPSSASASWACRDDWPLVGEPPGGRLRHPGVIVRAAPLRYAGGGRDMTKRESIARARDHVDVRVGHRRRARAGGGAVAPPRRRRDQLRGLPVGPPGRHRGHRVLRLPGPRSWIRPTGGRSCRGSDRATTWWRPAATRTAGPWGAWGPRRATSTASPSATCSPTSRWPRPSRWPTPWPRCWASSTRRWSLMPLGLANPEHVCVHDAALLVRERGWPLSPTIGPASPTRRMDRLPGHRLPPDPGPAGLAGGQAVQGGGVADAGGHAHHRGSGRQAGRGGRVHLAGPGAGGRLDPVGAPGRSHPRAVLAPGPAPARLGSPDRPGLQRSSRRRGWFVPPSTCGVPSGTIQGRLTRHDRAPTIA